MILISGSDEGIRQTVSNMLRLLGAVCEEREFLDEATANDSMYKAVLLVCPSENITPCLDIIEKRLGNIPTFTLLDRFCGTPSRARTALAFSTSVGLPQALDSIISECLRLGRTPPCRYRLLGIDASLKQDGVYYLGKKISFTRTEAMLLRVLLLAHPRPLYAKALLSLAFKPSRTPELANIRTHVSVMNKKFLFHTGKRLIEANENGQYALIT